MINEQALAEVQGTPTVTPGTCPAKLAYRSMADIGPARVCGVKCKPNSQWCGRHDPATMPKRDARGRILPKVSA